jgi:hypothetical protein
MGKRCTLDNRQTVGRNRAEQCTCDVSSCDSCYKCTLKQSKRGSKQCVRIWEMHQSTYVAAIPALVLHLRCAVAFPALLAFRGDRALPAE